MTASETKAQSADLETQEKQVLVDDLRIVLAVTSVQLAALDHRTSLEKNLRDAISELVQAVQTLQRRHP